MTKRAIESGPSVSGLSDVLAVGEESKKACAPQRFVCRDCKAEKTSDEFPNRKQNKSGKSSQCKKCLYEYVKLWAARKERVEIRKAWRASEAGKAASKKRDSRRKEELTDSYVAHVIFPRGGLGNKAATPEILEMKRQSLLLKRLSKQLRNATDESSKDPR